MNNKETQSEPEKAEKTEQLRRKIATVYVEGRLVRVKIKLLDRRLYGDRKPPPPDQFDLRAELGRFISSVDKNKLVGSVIFHGFSPSPDLPPGTMSDIYKNNTSKPQYNLAAHKDAAALREELTRQKELWDRKLNHFLLKLATIESQAAIKRTAEATTSNNIYITCNGGAYGINDSGEMIKNGEVLVDRHGEAYIFRGFIECTRKEFGQWFRSDPYWGVTLPLKFFKEIGFDGMSMDLIQDPRKMIVIYAIQAGHPACIFTDRVGGQTMAFKAVPFTTSRLVGVIQKDNADRVIQQERKATVDAARKSLEE